MSWSKFFKCLLVLTKNMTYFLQFVGVRIKKPRQYLAALNSRCILQHQDWIQDLIKWYILAYLQTIMEFHSEVDVSCFKEEL